MAARSLYAAAIQGEQAAWKQLHQELSKRLAHMSRGSAVEADDFIQNCLMDAYIHRRQVREVDSFAAWLMTIARRKRAEAFAKKSKERTVSWSECQDVTYAHVVRHMPVQEVKVECSEMLSTFSVPLQRCLIHRHLLGCSAAEIAEQENVSLSTAKRRLQRARERVLMLKRVRARSGDRTAEP